MGDCELEGYLKKHGVAYRIASKPTFPEYKLIEDFYGDKVARRSSKFNDFFSLTDFRSSSNQSH